MAGGGSKRKDGPATTHSRYKMHNMNESKSKSKSELLNSRRVGTRQSPREPRESQHIIEVTTQNKQ